MTHSDSSAFFSELMGAYRRTKLVLVAHRLGVFDALAAAGRSLPELSAQLGCDASTLAAVLDALVAMGVLEKRDAAYQNGPIAAQHLASTSPAYFGPLLEMHDRLWEGWSNLEEVVRTGRPWRTLPELLGADAAFADRYIRGMHQFSRRAAAEVARLLGPERVRHMLDVGGGPGTYSFALLERNTRARATLLDLEATLRITREFAAAHPDRERLIMRAANYLQDDYGQGFDLALMSHTTHDEPEHRVRDMLARAFAALEPGGRVAIHDWALDPTGTGPLEPVLFGVHVMLYTDGGRVHRLVDYLGWMEQAGFLELEHHAVLPGEVASPTFLVIGTKPR